METVEILSDDDEASPFPPRFKKRALDHGHAGAFHGTSAVPAPQILLVDDEDDPTPQKNHLNRTPLFVPDTPMSPPPPDPTTFPNNSIVRCTLPRRHSDKISGISGLICLESDDDAEAGCPKGSNSGIEGKGYSFRDGVSHRDNFLDGLDFPTASDAFASMDETNKWRSSRDAQLMPDFEDHVGAVALEDGLAMPVELKERGSGLYRSSLCDCSSDKDTSLQVHSDCDDEGTMTEKVTGATKKKGRRAAVNSDKRTQKDEERARKKQQKEERALFNEERKRKRQEEKLQKDALKAEAAEMKKLQKEKDKWEKGKFALKSIVAEIDAKVVESGAIGGHLLTRFAEKGLSFRITKNPVERSILWKMRIPDQISQLSSMGHEVPYIVFVFEAEEFCNLLSSDSLLVHAHGVRKQYPSFTVCYVTNKLMSYINKRELNQYKNPSNSNCWKRPPVEENLSKLTTDFARVHSSQCMDEADLAEHIVGLTSSLATCQFRKKLTWLTINANGSLVPKDFIDKNLIKKSIWLKALVAIPKVQPRFAMAIWKKYPTMRSLLTVYMDPNKTVHEKEFLLKDLIIEGELGKESRRLGEVCSKRVYRILMAQNGGSKTDDVEDGADLFGS